MGLTWLSNGFICKELYAPFVLDKDSKYLSDLREKYNIVINQAKKVGADDESLRVLQKFKTKIIDAVKCYYAADIEKCHTIIKNLIKDIGDNPLAVNVLNQSDAFPGDKNSEIQFFRCRNGNPANEFSAKEMLHLPAKLRSKSGNYRFSIPGNPCLYLANSSYGCWIETGFPSENEFNVAPVILDGTQKVFNLAISIRDCNTLNDMEPSRLHCWLKLYMLTIATSYRICEEGRTFKSEYIVSQSIMMACRKLGFDGVAYYSKRVNDEIFALCAINLVLFVCYDGEYSELIQHMKVDDAFNYSVYKQLGASLKYKDYELRTASTGLITNIGSTYRQYPYRETEFYGFDKFLFYTWRDKQNNHGKDKIPWGVSVK